MWYSPDLDACDYLPDGLTIFVVGASGDLAKKKTYPSLFDLFRHGFLTKRTTICGYARSQKTDKDFKESIRPFLKKGTEEQKSEFLDLCLYRNGAYDSAEDVAKVFQELEEREEATNSGKVNRLFYFAIPPSVFVPIGTSIKEAVISKSDPKKIGWNRLIVEKPFGHDSESFEELSRDMGALYTEDEIYRIDHYLGKEMVQNLVVLRFSNAIFEPLWNRNHIKSVMITFKENFGTKGRGGYFDEYGM
jgi:glucose-6-phosphate 1-dehydrogenase